MNFAVPSSRGMDFRGNSVRNRNLSAIREKTLEKAISAESQSKPGRGKNVPVESSEDNILC